MGHYLGWVEVGGALLYVICNRCLYKKSVKIFNESDYEMYMEGLTFQVNKKNQICHTCRKTL